MKRVSLTPMYYDDAKKYLPQTLEDGTKRIHVYGVPCLVWKNAGLWYGRDEKSKLQKQYGIQVEGTSENDVFEQLLVEVLANTPTTTQVLEKKREKAA